MVANKSSGRMRLSDFKFKVVNMKLRDVFTDLRSSTFAPTIYWFPVRQLGKWNFTTTEGG